MYGFFKKTQGAISVFLVIVLLPVMLFGGLVTDAARITLSKVVISDAGEMAMNGALAQYDTSLLDEYGLLVMDQNPSDYLSNITEMFNKSLSATGLESESASEDSYSKILDLVAENVNAYAVEGSQIYHSEAEKQQIVEYMKYRAPLCLVDLIKDKLSAMRDTQKKLDVINAEVEFAESMDQCQDAVTDAYNAVTDLIDAMNTAAIYSGSNGTLTLENVQAVLDQAEIVYKSQVAECMIKAKIISLYDEEYDTTDIDLDGKINLLVSAANATSDCTMNDPVNEDSFEAYLNFLYYKGGIDTIGGTDAILSEWNTENPEPAEGTTAHDAWAESKATLETKITNYNNAKNTVNGYKGKLEEQAKSLINNQSGNHVNTLRVNCENVVEKAEIAAEKLSDLNEKMTDSQTKWQNWSDKEDIAYTYTSTDDKPSSEYAYLFSGDNSAYDQLVTKVSDTKQYFQDIANAIQAETFSGNRIDHSGSGYDGNTTEQMAAMLTKAGEVLSGIELVAADIPNDLSGYKSAFNTVYNHADVTYASLKAWINLGEDTFYTTLKDWQGSEDTQENRDKKSEADGKLSEASDSASSASDDDSSYQTFNWTNDVENADTVLPSRVLSTEAQAAAAAYTSVGGDLDDRSSALQSFKNAISSASNFINGLDNIVSSALEDLYVAEYAMQMFSYYTVDIKDGSSIAEDDIITISGYKMNATSRKAYKAEVEYILWGDASSQKNVKNTMMLLFGIRLLFNCIYAFTDSTIKTEAEAIGAAVSLIPGFGAFLAPVVKVLYIMALAAIETGNDITALKKGYSVAIVKDSNTWTITHPSFSSDLEPGGNDPCNTLSTVSLSYAEYLRIFLFIKVVGNEGEQNTLARIADCIQVNNDYDLLNGYTMVSIDANVKSRTTFMKKISDWNGSGAWTYPDNYYYIHYQSVLGY